MGFEFDFLAVGEGERSGDAIAIRLGNLTGHRSEQFVMLIDAGTLQTGKDIVDHIKTYFRTETVDLALNTHPDSDHSSGFSAVLNELTVGQLWMHRPWEHSREICDILKHPTLNHKRLSAKMQKSLGNAWEVEKIANRKGIAVVEPFSDELAAGLLTVLGPTRHFYESLLADFRDMPVVENAFESAFGGLARGLLEKAPGVVERVAEKWHTETLVDPADDATSAENNSSVISVVSVDGHDFLFTGDAGVPALELAADKAESLGIDLAACRLQQAPHHGSKRNVGPSILDRIVGPKLPSADNLKTKVAFVSAAAKGAPKHPAKKVTNAYQRRGARVLATQGETLRHSKGAPPRQGWTAAAPLPFYSQVED